MRKSLFIIFVLFGTLLLACNKEKAEVSFEQEDTTYVINGLIASDLTRTEYTDDQYFSWDEGDKISVLFHNGNTNKFFTFTAVEGGSSKVSFEGKVSAGYEIGSSDTGSKWALFPANPNHTYTAGADNPVVFNVPSFKDYTESHFSADLPMAAQGDADNTFTFSHLAGTIKFAFTGIDNSVSKVLFRLDNQITSSVSGGFTLHGTGSSCVWWETYSTDNIRRSISFVADVVNNSVSFYVPFAHTDETHFQPTVTLTNFANGNVLKTLTAKTPLATESYRPNRYRMTVIPVTASGSGTAPALTSKFGLNWDYLVASGKAAYGYGSNGIKIIKGTADANYLYLYMEIEKSKLKTDDAVNAANRLYLYLGDSNSTSGSWSTKYTNEIGIGFLTAAGGDPGVSSSKPIYLDSKVAEDSDYYYYELKFDRTKDTYLSSSGHVNVGVNVFTSWTAATESWSTYISGPAYGKPMLDVTLP